jgi:hypothetical protein
LFWTTFIVPGAMERGKAVTALAVLMLSLLALVAVLGASEPQGATAALARRGLRMVTDDPDDDFEAKVPASAVAAAAGGGDGAGAAAEEEDLDPLLFDEETGHKYLMPLGMRDIGGLIFAAVGLMIAAGGGIGGGGMLVPIYIIVLGFAPKYAIPLSNVTVLGGAVTNVACAWHKRHPAADRPLIDWDLILVMQPMQLVGGARGAADRRDGYSWGVVCAAAARSVCPASSSRQPKEVG